MQTTSSSAGELHWLSSYIDKIGEAFSAMMFVGAVALWEKTKQAPCRVVWPSSRHFVIALAIVQLCLTPVNSNRCKVDAQKFESLDNATCLPRDYRDINEVTMTCSTTVTVLFSCLCKDYTGLPGGNSVRHPRYCLATSPERTGDYTANLKLGVCIEGRCDSSTFDTTLPVDLRYVPTAERLNLPPLPACTREEFNVKNMFFPLRSCEFFCQDRDNKVVNDGSPCVLEWTERVLGGPQVALTGQCWNGICKFIRPSMAPMELDCIDRELLTSETGVVSGCTFPCGSGTQNRANGVTCLISPETPWQAATIGVCFRGTCTEIVEVKNQPLGFIENKALVGAHCIYVANGQLKHRKHGAACVIARSTFTKVPQLLGYCSQGTCRNLPPYRPPPQEFNLKDCQVRNIKLTKKMYVAESCTVTCRNYQTEPRRNGIPCLFRFRTWHCYVFRMCSTYTIGQCFEGRCIYTSQSWDMQL